MGRLISSLLFWGGFVVGLRTAWQKFVPLLGRVAGLLSSAETHSPTLQKLAHASAAQYIVGRSADDALAAAEALDAQGISSSLLQLGETVQFTHEAVAERDGLLALIKTLGKVDMDASVSVKLSQLGHKLSRELALDSLRQLVEAAAAHDVMVYLETESAETVSATLAAFDAVRESGPLGIGLQAYLYRSADDLAQVLARVCPVRLSVGSYAETSDTALNSAEKRSANFQRLAEMALTSPNIKELLLEAHDDAQVQSFLDFVKAEAINKQAFKFEMLYKQRTDLRDHLKSLGYRVQVYLPYGDAWYPFVMRRMVEQPRQLQQLLGGL